MNQAVEAFVVLLIVANGIFSFRGFGDRLFLDRHVFHVEKIIGEREAHRLVTSAFLHANIAHFAFNMFALYSFSRGVGAAFGIINFVLIYFGSLIAGSLLALYIHRDHPDYRALGASGAVSGVIFSSIVLYPHGSIGILFLPMGIPSWLFGILFVAASIYGIRSGVGNTGHEAHLGGAIAGVLISIILAPALLLVRPLLVLGVLVPAVAFLFLVVRRPDLVAVSRIDPEQLRGGRETARSDRRRMRSELDGLLDKVGREGIGGLSDRERKRLHELSTELRKNR